MYKFVYFIWNKQSFIQSFIHSIIQSIKLDIEPTEAMLAQIASLQQVGRKARVPIVYAMSQTELYGAIGRPGRKRASFVVVTDISGAEPEMQVALQAWQKARNKLRSQQQSKSKSKKESTQEQDSNSKQKNDVENE